MGEKIIKSCRKQAARFEARRVDMSNSVTLNQILKQRKRRNYAFVDKPADKLVGKVGDKPIGK